MTQDPFNPYQAPQTLEPEPGWSGDEGQPAPLPWEDPITYPAFWPRVGAMFSLAFGDPMAFFHRVLATEEFGKPTVFLLLFCVPSMLFQLFIGLAMGAFFSSLAKENPSAFRGMPSLFFGGMFGLQALMLPVAAFISCMLFGLLDHAALWMWGGLRPGRPLIQTLRASLYAGAFMYLIMTVPLLGPLAAIVVLVFFGMGLARIHATDTWKGVVAVFTPMLFCCLCYAVLIATVIGTTAAFSR